MARTHKHGSLICEHPTKAACEQARRESFGKCVAMTEPKKKNAEPGECTNWGTSYVGDRAYCGTHAGGVLNAELEAQRAAVKRAELDSRIDAYMDFRVDYPSVWDRMAV